MKGTPSVWIRVRHLEATTAPGPPPVCIVFRDNDGTLRNSEGVPVVPPAGALVIVFAERSDGPQ